MHYIIVAFVVLGIIGGFVGYGKGRSDGYVVRDGECKVQLAEEEMKRVAAEREAAGQREQRRALADQLAEALHQSAERLKAQKVRYENEISRLASSHRRALDAELVRVLNRETRDDIREHSSSEAAPAAAGSATNPAPAAANRDGFGASERSVANWIVNAKVQYQSCVNQVKALVALWDEASR